MSDSINCASAMYTKASVYIVREKNGTAWGHFTTQLAAIEFADWLQNHRKVVCSIDGYSLQETAYQAINELKRDEAEDKQDSKRRKRKK